MSDKYFGNYLGIVVQNNDPDNRGRVKVWIPHLSASIYENWDEDFGSEETKDKRFIFPDMESNPDLTAILPELKKVLPWAEVASPVFGGASSGRYNAYLKKGTTSDSNAWSVYNRFQEDQWDPDEQTPGFRPLQNYTGVNKVSDEFSETDKKFTLINPHSHEYTPSDYSNLARGEFTIPNVGAHVWVFFNGGYPTAPVVWAAAHGAEDWRRIFSLNKDETFEDDHVSPDYPGGYENIDREDIDQATNDIKTFRSKHVFNSNKHALEFIDTDAAETIKLTHYSGSFISMQNAVTTRLATNNDQLLVMQDQFLTVRKNQGIYIAEKQEVNIGGDRVLTLGDPVERRAIALQQIKAWSEVSEVNKRFEIARTNLSKYDPRFLPCPVCSGSGRKFGEKCVTCAGTGRSPSSQHGGLPPEPAKWAPAPVSWTEFREVFDQGTPARAIFELSDIPARAKWEYKWYIPNIQPKNVTRMHQKIWQAQKISLALEERFGAGGDDIKTVTGSRVETIGTAMNTHNSWRVDNIGKLRNWRLQIAPDGTYVAMEATALIEHAAVPDVLGGDYTLTVTNGYKLNVGSKGVQIKTTGPISIGGTIIDISSEASYISANKELYLGSAGYMEVKANRLKISSGADSGYHTLLDSNVGISQNLTVRGGTHVEGELSLHHLTAPEHMYITDIGYGPLPHVHVFYAPAWNLEESPTEVRKASQGTNRWVAAPNKKCVSTWIPV